jgi:hypothetical protein
MKTACCANTRGSGGAQPKWPAAHVVKELLEKANYISALCVLID